MTRRTSTRRGFTIIHMLTWMALIALISGTILTALRTVLWQLPRTQAALIVHARLDNLTRDIRAELSTAYSVALSSQPGPGDRPAELIVRHGGETVTYRFTSEEVLEKFRTESGGRPTRMKSWNLEHGNVDWVATTHAGCPALQLTDSVDVRMLVHLPPARKMNSAALIFVPAAGKEAAP